MSWYADEAVEGFERSRACFEQIVAGLAAAEANGQTHSELEERLAGECRGLIRQLLQDHLGSAGDTRAAPAERAGLGARPRR